MNGSKALDSSMIKAIKRTAVACAAAAMMISGSTVAASAADPGLPGGAALQAGKASLEGGKVTGVTTSGTNNTVTKTTGTTGTTSTKTTTTTTSTKTTSTTAKTTTKVSLPKMTLNSESRFSTGNTHPFGAQTNKLRISWKKVSNATGYQVSIKGGKYKNWTRFKTLSASAAAATFKGLARGTTYQFRVRAVNGDKVGTYSDPQTLSTSRIDFDAAGWKAMCRIVYHEVGQSSDSCWDEPIVHVADCVVNRYEAAKYLNDPLWEPFYRGYNSVQSMIYQSGGFMSDAGLANDGATYAKVSAIVKNAVYGTLYGRANVKNIKHNKNIFYWQNTSYKPSGSKVAYVYPIPWGGYFSIWKEYWG